MPFRWDLVTPDQLGSLLAGTTPPRLGFLDDLVSCAGRVVARSQDGDLFFVGRSLDSMFDLLGGAFAAAGIGMAVHRLPLSAFDAGHLVTLRRRIVQPCLGARFVRYGAG